MKYAKRLLLALLISATGFLITDYWYKKQAASFSSLNQSQKKAIAQLKKRVNEVQRKPLTRVIWESLSGNELLHAGESIRTGLNSEAQILFLKTGTAIELEPNSQVVLEESSNGLALNFLKGNLYIKGKSHKGLTLKTGNTEIALNNATLSVSKSLSGQTALEVFKGKAQVKQNGKTVALDQAGVIGKNGVKKLKDRILILEPLPGSTLYVNAQKKTPVIFRWKKLPPGYTVYLELGKNKAHLKRTQISAPGEKGEVRVRIKKSGKRYWRLVALPKNPKQGRMISKTLPVHLQLMRSPLPLFPENQSKVVLKSDKPQLNFQWLNKTPFSGLYLEVAKDPELKTVVHKQALPKDTSSYTFTVPESGTYFWRVTGFFKNKETTESLPSPIQQFKAQVGVVLIPPKLRSPVDQQRLSHNKVLENGVLFSWKLVSGIKKYKLFVQNDKTKKVIEKEVSLSPYKWDHLPDGAYTWWMRSLGPKGRMSKPSVKHRFFIKPLPKVHWATGDKPSTYYYVTTRPHIKIHWKPFLKATAYRVQYGPVGTLTEDTPWIYTKKTLIKKWVDEPGEYEALVEALNDQKKVIARSSVKIIDVQERPLLPSPEMNMPVQIRSNKRGDVTLKWKPVKGAQFYEVLLKNKEGKVVKKARAKRAVASLRRLRPGTYSVSVKAVDQYQRASAESEARKLLVPKVSNIAAPKLKNIKVK
ncbi:MAG: hypothetical protein D6797_02845 [Bdellovibrio sp.]|nr:MAG: hypothetical protein D6797_02845 [Bdellovibrio sp.]